VTSSNSSILLLMIYYRDFDVASIEYHGKVGNRTTINKVVVDSYSISYEELKDLLLESQLQDTGSKWFVSGASNKIFEGPNTTTTLILSFIYVFYLFMGI
jgi:hypothetical protein